MLTAQLCARCKEAKGHSCRNARGSKLSKADEWDNRVCTYFAAREGGEVRLEIIADDLMQRDETKNAGLSNAAFSVVVSLVENNEDMSDVGQIQSKTGINNQLVSRSVRYACPLWEPLKYLPLPIRLSLDSLYSFASKMRKTIK